MSLARLIRHRLSTYPPEMVEDEALRIMTECEDNALMCQDDVAWICAAWYLAEQKAEDKKKANGHSGGRVVTIVLTDAMPLKEAVS